MKKEYKPGPGWEKLNNAVYQKGMFRIHVGGLLIKSIPLGRIERVNHEKVSRFIKINGGNRKRGLMAYANHCRFVI